jgi:type IV secretion system protein VirB3
MSRNNGLQTDPLFVAVTRPAMRWGVTDKGLLLNGVIVIEMFLLTKNLLWLVAFVPIHEVLALLLLNDCRYFELLGLWGRTKGWNMLFGNSRHWKANSYSPLHYSIPDKKGNRRLSRSYV